MLLQLLMMGGIDAVLIAGQSGSPGLKVYEDQGSNLIDLNSAVSFTQVRGVSISDTGQFAAAVHAGGDQLTIYEMADGILTPLAAPADLPSNPTKCAFSPGATYLCVTQVASPYHIIYKRSGSTFNKITGVNTPPTDIGRSPAFSPNGNYLAIGHDDGISVYKRTADAFNLLVGQPEIQPTGRAINAAWSADSTYLALAMQDGTGGLAVLKRSDDALTPIAVTQPAGDGLSVAFAPSGNHLAVGIGVSPYLENYARSGDVFSKLTSPANLPASAVQAVGYSVDSGRVIAGCVSLPRLIIYSRSSNTFTKLPTTSDQPTAQVLTLALYPVGVPGSAT